MNMYDAFEGDASLEKEGVWIDYGQFRVKVAHTGGANQRYTNYAEKQMRPLRRAISTGTIGEDRSKAVLHDIFAKTVVKDWQVRQDDEWVPGVQHPATGEIVPMDEEVVKLVFDKLPRLFNDIQAMAGELSNYRQEELEEESKNS